LHTIQRNLTKIHVQPDIFMICCFRYSSRHNWDS